MTTADLLLNQDSISDGDQRLLLNELRRFLTHESAGVKGFDRMPKEWDDLNKLREKHQITSELDLPNAAAPLSITVDINRRNRPWASGAPQLPDLPLKAVGRKIHTTS